MTLGAENVETTNRGDFVVLFVCVFFIAVKNLGPLVGGNYVFVSRVIPNRALGLVHINLYLALSSTQWLSNSLLDALLLRHELRIAPKQNVSTAARHVGGDGDHILAARLSHDFRFTLVVFGVENHVLDSLFLQ